MFLFESDEEAVGNGVILIVRNAKVVLCFCRSIEVMSEDLIASVDRLISPESLLSAQGFQATGTSKESSSSHTVDPSVSASTIDIKEDEEAGGEDEPLIQSVECRICQEEDSIKNLEIPCACNGSLKVSCAYIL